MRRNGCLCLSLLLAALAPAAAGCGGVDESVRGDITRQMETARGSYAACYSSALVRNAAVAGPMTLAFRVDPASGSFSGVAVTQGPASPTR
jgi:hypothetical protein